MILIKHMNRILQNIKLDEKLKQKVIDLAARDKVKILLLADKCKNGCYNCLRTKPPLLRLAVVLYLADKAYDEYKKIGISDSVYYDTFDDIRIWCENCVNKGLKNYRWLQNHIFLKLFKIGRLQYQIFPCRNKTLNYKMLPFDYGENLIYVHIPQGSKLGFDSCVSSLRDADRFFYEYFPDYNFRYYFCESWLLFDANREFMAKNSNIIRFSSLFDIRYSEKIDFQAIERIFKKRRIFAKNYPRHTSLQRRAADYIAGGGKLGIGIGVIDRQTLPYID